MKISSTLLFITVTFHIAVCFAQHESDIWYFGGAAGIDFNSGSPVNLTNGQLFTVEGCASISDSAGNLLFYTDGITVWNRNHLVMSMGNGLHGGASSTQSAIIVKQPGNDSLYYIFTTGEMGAYGLEYSIVNMNLQGGLGEVILKNVLLVSNTNEKVTATKHSNGSDIWIITSIGYSDQFYAYLLTNSGVNTTPVVTSIGPLNIGQIGYMKTSVSGKKLASAIHDTQFCELFDFDISTGILSNHMHLLLPPTDIGPYGVEFSPNEQVLYCTAYTPAIIVQWDLSSGVDSAIQASRITVATTASDFNGAIQLASDGKIYMARYLSNWLGVINDPDVNGLGCNYVDNGFDLSPRMAQLGLPDVAGFYISTGAPQSSFFASDTSVCKKFCMDFFDQSTNDPTSWLWSFPGGAPSSSTDQNPQQICYNFPGQYDVTLVTSNSSGNDTLTLPGYITVHETPPAPVITQNGNVLTCSPASLYQWQLNNVDIPGATQQSYTYSQPGVYTVFAFDSNGCVNYASIVLTGEEALSSNTAFTLFPNPLSGDLNIELITLENMNVLDIEVMNMLGQQVYFSGEKNLSSSFTKTISMRQLPAGVYFLQLRVEGLFGQYAYFKREVMKIE